MEVAESDDGKNFYNFMINASNQANLSKSANISTVQLNSIFVFISPYKLEKVEIEGLDIDIRMDDNGFIVIKDHKFEPVEITPGVCVLGVLKQ